MKYFTALLLFIVLSACTDSSETKFSKEGISFICPKGWHISEEEDFGDAGYYLACEKDGYNSSELITFSWFQDTTDLLFLLETYVESVEQSLIDNGFELKVHGVEKSKYAGHLSYMQGYEAEGLGEEVVGEIHCFHMCNISVTVLLQMEKKVSNESREEMEKIEKSLSCTD